MAYVVKNKDTGFYIRVGLLGVKSVAVLTPTLSQVDDLKLASQWRLKADAAAASRLARAVGFDTEVEVLAS